MTSYSESLNWLLILSPSLFGARLFLTAGAVSLGIWSLERRNIAEDTSTHQISGVWRLSSPAVDNPD